MAIIKTRNKKTGILYAYESESYWDKEKQQPRSRRKLIGKVDETTGEIIPTRKKSPSGRQENTLPDKTDGANIDMKQMCEECRSNTSAKEVIDLRRQLAVAELKAGRLEAENKKYREIIRMIHEKTSL